MTPTPSQPAAAAKVYHCGSLTYTRRHLAVLFFWLLWGDFCYVLMEAVTPSIMPLKFKELGASNFQLGLILGTIPSLIYSALNPVISFKSDRYRSRWGRRIPFILFTLPFLVASLIGLAYGDRLGYLLQGKIGILSQHFAPSTIALWTIGALLALFTIFNTFVTSTFWYLFNDVVPEHLLSRFMSWFRMISLAATALYNFCIFRFADTHSAEILVGAALLYFVGFGLMCFYVKEGEYPPPPPNVDGQSGPFSAVKTYWKECLGMKHYWYQWIGTFLSSVAGGVNTFVLLFSLAIGLSLAQIGIINGSVSLLVSVLVLGTGWLADRYHPIRVVMAGGILSLVVATPATLIWIFWHPAPQVAFWVSLAIGLGLTAPAQALVAMSDPPLLMRLFPRERYGQFCSTNGIWRAIGGMIGGGLAGGFLDITASYVGKENSYFYIPVWTLFFSLPAVMCSFALYRSWKRHGGDVAYVPPMVGPAQPLAAPLIPETVNR